MTELKLDKMRPEVAAGFAKVMAELTLLSKEDPLAVERVAELADGSVRAERLMTAVLEILPAEIDAEQWLAWIEGASFGDGGRVLLDPDKGRQKSARGAWQSAVDLRDRMACDVATCRQKLVDAELLLGQAEHAVKAADAQLRAVVCYRFMIDASKLVNRVFALGPLFTIGRAISVYQRRDAAFEEALDATARAWIDEHLANREDTSRRVLELLDLFAGDAAIEIKLHHAIHKILVDAWAGVEAEIMEARRTGARLSPTAKRTVRNHEQRRATVRREGLRNDYLAVLEGLVSAERDQADDATVGEA